MAEKDYKLDPLAQGGLKVTNKLRKQAGYAIQVQSGRSTGAVMISDDEVAELEEEVRGEYTIFGMKKCIEEEEEEEEKPIGGRKLIDVAETVLELRQGVDLSVASKKEQGEKEDEAHFMNADRFAMLQQRDSDEYQRDNHRPGDDLIRALHRPAVDPALARLPDAYLNVLFSRARKHYFEKTRSHHAAMATLDAIIDCSACRKAPCFQHRPHIVIVNGQRKITGKWQKWQPTCGSCRETPCDKHSSRGRWQQTDFKLCPHISMQLFWTTDDLYNTRDSWEFHVSPIYGDKAEHEGCKGGIMGVQCNIERLGDMVGRSMDRMALGGPENVGRVIRDMLTYQRTAEVESQKDNRVLKVVRDGNMREKERDRIKEKKGERRGFEKKRKVVEKKRKKEEGMGLTVELLEGGGEEESGEVVPVENVTISED